MNPTLLILFLAVVRGVVLDPSARPVEGARIKCGAASTLTDARGRFEIAGTDACEATVTREGFAESRLSLRSIIDAEIVLKLAPRSERVVVSATRAPIAIEEAGVAADVFTSRDFAQRQFPLLTEVLRDVPGLSVVKTGRNGGLTSVFARGGQSTSTLVLFDGVPLTEPGGAINYAHLTSGGLERMEVVRGPESALFGAEASSAVIQLFPRRGDPEARVPHGSISYERGSFSTDRWMANISGGILSRIDYSLTADQLRTAGEFPNDFYRNTTGTANLGFRISAAATARAFLQVYDADAGTPGSVGYGIIDRDAHENDRDWAMGARIDDSRGARYAHSAYFGLHRYRYDYQDSEIDGPYNIAALIRTVNSPLPRVYLVRLVSPSLTVPDPGTQLVQRSTTFFPFPGAGATNRASAGYQGALAHRGGTFIGGYSFENQSGVISAIDVNRTRNGVYFHEQYSLMTRIFLTAGARVEHSSAFGTRFVPRGSASFRLPRDVWFRVSTAHGILEPSLLQNFANEGFFVGSRALRPEKTNSYEAGLSREWMGRRLRTDFSVFRNSFRDLIIFDFSQFPGTWRNLERSWGRGFEASGQMHLARFVELRGGYTKLFTRIVESSAPASARTGIGQELVRRPRNSGYVSLALVQRRWTFIAGGRMAGERQDGDIFGVTRNPGYQHVYLSGSWQGPRNITPFLRVENLLNARYSEVLGYPSLSRSVLGGLRVHW
jgi:outer membrane cobalamin receptor